MKYREKLRVAGTRPILVWVPDTRRSGFKEECRQQSLLVKHEAHEKELLAFPDEAADRVVFDHHDACAALNRRRFSSCRSEASP